jgi:opacity protein-like surface antigen
LTAPARAAASARVGPRSLVGPSRVEARRGTPDAAAADRKPRSSATPGAIGHPPKEVSMLRKIVLLAALGVFLLPAAVAQAQFEEGDWELTLFGSGASNEDVEVGSFELGASLGYFLTDGLEVAARQSVSYSDFNNGTNLNGSTAVVLDFHFDLDRFQPFIGAGLGYAYGDTVQDTFFAGPEGGVKYFVNSTTFIFAIIQYQFFFDDEDDVGDVFDDGLFFYGVGIGVTW